MAAADIAAHGCKPCASVPVRWRIGPNGLCALSASIPAPSIRGRARAFALRVAKRPCRPVPFGSPSALALYRRLAGRLASGARPFCALRRAVARLGAAAPGRRCGSFGTAAVKAAASGGPRLRSPPPWAPPLAWPAAAGLRFPSPAGPRLCGRWPGAGASGSWGAGGFAPSCCGGPSWCPAPSGFFPRPPLSPGFAWRRLRRRCFSSRGDVASFASLGSWARPGRDGRQVLRSGCADAKTSPGYVPLNGCFPCPSSFAIDLCCPGGLQWPGR